MEGPKFVETEARAEAQPEPEADLPQCEVRVPRWYVETVRDSGVQEIAEPTGGPRRSQRLRQRGDTSQGESVNFALMAKIEGETKPSTFEEAAKNYDWCDAMNCEYNSIMQNHTWDLVDLPRPYAWAASDCPRRLSAGQLWAA